jgi:hypothetical protein
MEVRFMQQGFQLRDVFNPTVVDQLAHNIARTWPTFDQVGFAATINAQLGPLSLGARNTLIRDTLWAYLPKDFPQAVQILVDSLGLEIPHCEVTGFDGFIVVPQMTLWRMCGCLARVLLLHFELARVRPKVGETSIYRDPVAAVQSKAHR